MQASWSCLRVRRPPALAGPEAAISCGYLIGRTDAACVSRAAILAGTHVHALPPAMRKRHIGERFLRGHIGSVSPLREGIFVLAPGKCPDNGGSRYIHHVIRNPSTV